MRFLHFFKDKNYQKSFAFSGTDIRQRGTDKFASVVELENCVSIKITLFTNQYLAHKKSFYCNYFTTIVNLLRNLCNKIP